MLHSAYCKKTKKETNKILYPTRISPVLVQNRFPLVYHNKPYRRVCSLLSYSPPLDTDRPLSGHLAAFSSPGWTAPALSVCPHRGRCSIPWIIFVSLLWTHSYRSTSLLYWKLKNHWLRWAHHPGRNNSFQFKNGYAETPLLTPVPVGWERLWRLVCLWNSNTVQLCIYLFIYKRSLTRALFVFWLLFRKPLGINLRKLKRTEGGDGKISLLV